MVIIADTSCLITLERSDQFIILNSVFGEIFIPIAIMGETSVMAMGG